MKTVRINSLSESSKRAVFVFSLLMLVTLFSIHNAKYALVYLWAAVYGYFFIRNSKHVEFDPKLTFVSLIWMLPGAFHFVMLWSNLTIVGRIAGLFSFSAEFYSYLSRSSPFPLR